jgi:hypothetical protein
MGIWRVGFDVKQQLSSCMGLCQQHRILVSAISSASVSAVRNAAAISGLISAVNQHFLVAAMLRLIKTGGSAGALCVTPHLRSSSISSSPAVWYSAISLHL